MGGGNLIEQFLDNEALDTGFLKQAVSGFDTITEKFFRLAVFDTGWIDASFRERLDIYERIWHSYKVTDHALVSLDAPNLSKSLAHLKQHPSLGRADFLKLVSESAGEALPEKTLEKLLEACQFGWHYTANTLFPHTYNKTFGENGRDIPKTLPEKLLEIAIDYDRETVENKRTEIFCRDREQLKMLPEAIRRKLADGKAGELDVQEQEIVRKKATSYCLKQLFDHQSPVSFMLLTDLKFFSTYRHWLENSEHRKQAEIFKQLLAVLKQKVAPAEYRITAESLAQLAHLGISAGELDAVRKAVGRNGNEIRFNTRRQLDAFLRKELGPDLDPDILVTAFTRSADPEITDLQLYMNYIRVARDLQEKIRAAETAGRDERMAGNRDIAGWYLELLAQRGLYHTKLENKILDVLRNLVRHRSVTHYPFAVDAVFRQWAVRFETSEIDLLESTVIPDPAVLAGRYRNPVTISQLVKVFADCRSKTLLAILNKGRLGNPALPRRNNETLELLIEFIRSFEKCYGVSDPLYSDQTDMTSAVKSLGIRIERTFEKTENAKPKEEQYLHRLGIDYDAKKKNYYYL